MQTDIQHGRQARFTPAAKTNGMNPRLLSQDTRWVIHTLHAHHTHKTHDTHTIYPRHTCSQILHVHDHNATTDRHSNQEVCSAYECLQKILYIHEHNYTTHRQTEQAKRCAVRTSLYRSCVTKSCSSAQNSTPVGPPPTTAKCNRLFFSSAETPG